MGSVQLCFCFQRVSVHDGETEDWQEQQLRAHRLIHKQKAEKARNLLDSILKVETIILYVKNRFLFILRAELLFLNLSPRACLSLSHDFDLFFRECPDPL